MPLLSYNEWKQWNENFPSIPLFGKKHIIGKRVAEEEIPPELMGDDPMAGEPGAEELEPGAGDEMGPEAGMPEVVPCPHCGQPIPVAELLGGEEGVGPEGDLGDLGAGPEGLPPDAALDAVPDSEFGGSGDEEQGPELDAGGEDEEFPPEVQSADDHGLFDDPDAEIEEPNPDAEGEPRPEADAGPFPAPPAKGDQEEIGDEEEAEDAENPDHEAEETPADEDEEEATGEEDEDEEETPKPKTEGKKCCSGVAKSKKDCKKGCNKMDEGSFEKKLSNMMKGTVHQKFSSGLEEAMAVEDAIYAYQDLNADIDQPGPGEPGFAPAGKMGPSKLGTGVTMSQLNKIIPTQGR